MKEQIKVLVLDTTTENKRDNYKVRISYNNENFETTFHDSIYNHEHGISLNTDDVIYAVLMDSWAYDSCNSIKDFASEFGYDLYDELEEDYNLELLRVYSECHKTYDAMKRMFNDSELEELQKEFENY